MKKNISISLIKKLNDAFLELKEDEYSSFISFYQKHKTTIENIDITQSVSHFEFKLKTTGNYGRCLFIMKSYSKAIEVLKEAIKIFESGIKLYFKNEIISGNYYYEFLLSIYAESLFMNKNFKISKKEFKRLTTLYPNNKSYKGWYKSSIFYKYNWLFNLILITSGLILIYNVFFSIKAPIDLSITAIVVSSITYIIKWGLKQYIKIKYFN